MGPVPIVTRAMALLLLAACSAFAAASSLVSVRVYPMPWKPGSGDPAFDAQAVTFDTLPPGAEVTIYTLRGQQLWRGAADANGVVTWPGINASGRTVASGTYLALLEHGGRKTTRRVIVLR